MVGHKRDRFGVRPQGGGLVVMVSSATNRHGPPAPHKTSFGLRPTGGGARWVHLHSCRAVHRSAGAQWTLCMAQHQHTDSERVCGCRAVPYRPPPQDGDTKINITTVFHMQPQRRQAKKNENDSLSLPIATHPTAHHPHPHHTTAQKFNPNADGTSGANSTMLGSVAPCVSH